MSPTVGTCNKCGEERELVLEGTVCKACNDALDKLWGSAQDTDWVLVTTYRPENIQRIMESLRQSLGKTGDVPLERRLNLNIYRDTTYAAMKSRWALAQSFEGLTSYCFPTAEDVAMIRLLAVTENATLIRPATEREVAKHDKWRRFEQQCQIIEQIFAKWGFDDEGRPVARLNANGKPLAGFDDQGRPLDGGSDPEVEDRKAQANAEIDRVLRERGLEFSEEEIRVLYGTEV